MSASNLALYGITWLLVALTPGPAVFCVISLAVRYGWRAACPGILGIQIGNTTFFLCIAGGLVALLATATHALAILQFAGASYLLYLGIRMIMSSFRASLPNQRQGFGTPSSRRLLILQALVIQVTNPKALLFVSALLPQFLDPSRSMPVQLMVLLVCTVAIDTLVLGSYALLVGRGMRAFHSDRISRWCERTLGAALVGFGIKLLAWKR